MLDASLAPALIALLFATSVSAGVYVLMYPYISGDRQRDKRVATVTESRAVKTATRSAAEIAASRKKQVTDTLKDIEARQAAKEKLTLRLRLERAGLDAEPRTFWIISAIVGVVCAGAAMFLAPPSVSLFAAAIAGFVGAFGIPRFVLSKMISRRQSKFAAELANALDVIVRGIKSGLPLGECLQIIARESPEPVAGEFREVVEQQRIGVTLPEALERMTRRMPTADVKFLAIVITIQQQAGGNLSEALGNLTGVLRDRQRMSMKVKALSAEAKASAAVLGSLPPGVMTMVSISSPDYLTPLYNTTTGNLLVLGGIVWMGSGILIMRKMINFKF